MNRKRFLYLSLVLTMLLAGLVMPLFQPSVAVAAPPDTPNNISPTGSGIGLTPTLTSDNFSDSDNDTHIASRWEIALAASHATNPDGSYSSTVYNSGDASPASTSIVVPSGTLTYSATYYWHVRYEDNTTAWSPYSPETSFTTVAPPLAAFTADKTAAVVGQTINFTDNSTGGVAPLTYQWDFNNDSTWDNTTQNPSYSYSSAGIYTVVLKVTDAALNTDNETKTNYITVTTGPVAGFSANRTAVALGQPVTFTDNSTGGVAPLTYQWDFNNDNVTDSTVQSPSYIYGSAGTYAVVLKVTDAATNTDNETKTNYITVTTGLLADFSTGNVSVALGQSIQFTNLSGGGVAPLGYQWDFNNDGTWESTVQSPSYTYSSAGTYTVVLKVTDNATNTATKTKPNYIRVNQAPNPPTNSLPANLATGVSLTPTLQSSPFNDPGDTHMASQWQTFTVAGN